MVWPKLFQSGKMWLKSVWSDQGWPNLGEFGQCPVFGLVCLHPLSTTKVLLANTCLGLWTLSWDHLTSTLDARSGCISFVFQVSALFEFYIDSQLRFDTMKYMIKSYTPIPHQHWFTERPFYLENWYAVPGGYFLNQIAFEQLQLGQNHYMIVGMESCDELSEVLELSTTNKVYSGDPYQPWKQIVEHVSFSNSFITSNNFFIPFFFKTSINATFGENSENMSFKLSFNLIYLVLLSNSLFPIKSNLVIIKLDIKYPGIIFLQNSN